MSYGRGIGLAPQRQLHRVAERSRWLSKRQNREIPEHFDLCEAPYVKECLEGKHPKETYPRAASTARPYPSLQAGPRHCVVAATHEYAAARSCRRDGAALKHLRPESRPGLFAGEQNVPAGRPILPPVHRVHYRTMSGGDIDQTLANRLLAALPRVERQALLAHCDYVELTAPLPLQEEQGRLRHAYFPVDSTISVLAPGDKRRSLEVGAVGCEGLFGPESGMEVDSFELMGFIQGSGHAWRVDAATLQHLTTSHQHLKILLTRYLHVMLVQTARNVACCRFHSLEQRLARWLLTHSDRSWSNDLPVTHDQLALMLGARRAGVTVAAGRLEQRGLISGGRGHIVVNDREQLAAVACSCYRLDRQTYEHGMGVPPTVRRY